MIGGVGYTPAYLRSQIKELKEGLKDPNGKFGVDLLLPRTCFISSHLFALSRPLRFYPHPTRRAC